MLLPEPERDADGAFGSGEGNSNPLSLIKINVLSSLPEGEPQGSFVLHAPPTATGRDLLRRVCKMAKVPLKNSYVLITDDGDRIHMDRQLASITSIQKGKSLIWNSSDNPEFAGGKCWNAYWFMTLLSFLIGALGFAAIITLYLRVPNNTQYGVVFDAGSSHTAMYIYKWEGDKINFTAVAIQDGEKCTADGGGISSYSNNTAAAGASLTKCLDSAKSQIPTEKHGETPVYLGATAGMRLLQIGNPIASEAVLESVRKTISTYPFKFTNPTSQARIVNGSDEGAFGWITSNFITGSFHVHPPSDAVLPDLIVKSVGALDLGGASTQITFVPNDTKRVPEDFQFYSRLYGSNFSLYTHSYLCYGINEAANRLLALLVEENSGNSTNLTNPCAPAGSVINIAHTDLFSSACVNNSQALLAYGRHINPFTNINREAVYTFHGGSNETVCRALVTERMFNLTANCSYVEGPCSFNGVFQPPVYGDYYAFSSYFYLMEFLNLSSPDMDAVAYKNFSQATKSLCAKDWGEVQTMKSDAPHNLPWYCFQSVYIDTLLVNGYHFDPNTTWASIHFVGSIRGVDIGWSLGFIIDESNKLPTTTATRDLTTVTFALLTVLFSAFVITSLLFLRWARKQKAVSSRSHSFRGNTYGAI